MSRKTVSWRKRLEQAEWNVDTVLPPTISERKEKIVRALNDKWQKVSATKQQKRRR